MLERNYVFFRLLPLVSLLLVSCSVHLPYFPDESQTLSEWHRHQRSVFALKHYETRGTFAYISTTQKVYARFNWQRISTDHYRLILINPLGNTEVDLNIQLGLTPLVKTKGKCYVNEELELMIQNLTSMSIPLNDLRQWIIGLPGNATDFTLNSRGYLYKLNYSYKGQEWTVTYKDYHNDTVPLLPLNLELCQGTNRIKLKIYSWSL